jgi:Cu+-exporting ATPase
MNNINFKLAGLTCEACVKLVEKRLKKVPGVTDVNIDLASGNAQVSSVADLDPGILEESLAGTDYSIVK